MKITVQDIPETGLDVKQTEEVSGQGGKDRLTALMDLNISRLERDVFIRGEVSSSMAMSCSRCLGEYVQELAVPVNLAYSPSEEMGPGHEKHELGDDEMVQVEKSRSL